MSVRIASNISSLAAQRRVGDATRDLSKVSERLSSGLRINKAVDDAAGLQIAKDLQSDSRVYGQAIKNVNDGLSLLNIAQSATEQLSKIVIRQAELAEQALNGVYSSKQRQVMNAEANALVREYNRIIQTTSFNGINTLSGITNTLRMQLGYGENGGISVSVGGSIGFAAGNGGMGGGTVEVTKINTVTDGSSYTSGDYFTLHDGTNLHYFWFNVDNAGGDPGAGLPGAIGHQISIFSSDPANIISFAAWSAIQAVGTFSATQGYGVDPVEVITVFNNNPGSVEDSTYVGFWGGTSVSIQGSSSGASSTYFVASGSAYAVSSADLNDDGFLDLVSSGTSGRMTVMLGNGNGTFLAARSYVAGGSTGPDSLVLADVNNDGIADVLVATSSSRVEVLLGNGDGTFRNSTSYATGSNPLGIAVADFNGDGNMDLVSADSSSNSLSVMFGNGDGSYSARRSYVAGSAPYSVSVADFNGDGVMDLVSADSGAGRVSILLGNADGTFRARNSFVAGSVPRTVAVGDVNGDGVSDLVTGDRSGGTISVLLGNGDGSFSARVSYTATNRIETVRLADLNGDGVLDVIGSSNPNNVLGVGDPGVILLGNSNGSFNAPSLFAPFDDLPALTSVTVGDFNGNGILDAFFSTDLGMLSFYSGDSDSAGRRNNRMANLDLTTKYGAKQALGLTRSALSRIATELGVLGAMQSRLSYASQTLVTSRTNYDSAQSQLQDADVAQESASLVKTSIVQRAATAVLAQANQQPALALRLLGRQN